MISRMEQLRASDPTSRALLERDRMQVNRQLTEEGILSAPALSAEAQRESLRQQQTMQGLHPAGSAFSSLVGDAAEYVNPGLGVYGQMFGEQMFRRAGGDARLPLYSFPQSTQQNGNASAEASRAVRETLIDISQQSRGPSTLAAPDVDR